MITPKLTGRNDRIGRSVRSSDYSRGIRKIAAQGSRGEETRTYGKRITRRVGLISLITQSFSACKGRPGGLSLFSLTKCILFRRVGAVRNATGRFRKTTYRGWCAPVPG